MTTASTTPRARRGPTAALPLALAAILLSSTSLHCRAPTVRPTFGAGDRAVGSPTEVEFAASFDPELERLAHADPLGFLKRCRDRYRENVRDYRGLFTWEERTPNGLTPEQVARIRFRETPYSVDMRWIKNARQAKRVTYVAGRWEKAGRPQLRIELNGWLALLAPGGVRRDIHSSLVAAAARRPIDQFGYFNTLDLMIGYCDRARGHPEFELRYVGRGLQANRPCYVFVRRLPYGNGEVDYPDRVLDVHIDAQWLVPTGCFSYADDARTKLIGRYMLTDPEFNVGLTDEDF